MGRALAGLLALLLAAGALGASPATSIGASKPAAKHGCKKPKHKRSRQHRKKRCRKKSGGTTPSGDKPGSTDEPGDQTGPPGRLLATELEISPTELRLQLSRASVAAGPTIVQQYNSGADPHNLILERQGTVAFSYPTLDPGLSQSQTVNLARGTWTLYCGLLDHRALGMQATLTVN